jgi:hypothetical protein
MMRRFLAAGLLFAALQVLSAQAGSAKPQANKVRVTANPVWTLAMDWPRVAYASGKEGNTVTIHVWNLVTGATSVVKSKNHGFATHHTAEIAIAGKRLAWVRSVQFGNTELDHWLYTTPLGGSAHLLSYKPGNADIGCGPSGPQIGGLVGSGNMLAVSTWTVNRDYSASRQQLKLITPTGLRTIATGADAIVSASADGSHIAALPPATQNVIPEGCGPSTPPTSVTIYDMNGTLLKTIALNPSKDQHLSPEIALSGKRLATLNTEAQTGSIRVTLAVYDSTTGALMHTWPMPVKRATHLAVYGHLAAVEGPYRVYLVDLNTGKNVKIGPVSGWAYTTAIGRHGLVYAFNPHNTGRLVFVPMAKLLARLK